MHISELRIRNFRNFQNARFRFCKGVNTLIGENGSGKTNAFYALRLLLDDTMPRSAIVLRETDFCRTLGIWKGHWIVISIDFEELDPSEGCQLLKHLTGHMNQSGVGTYSLIFRPKQDVRKKLFTMTMEHASSEDISSYLNTLSIDNYEVILTGRASDDILDDTIYDKLVGDFTRGIFPDPDEEDLGSVGVRVAPLHPEISCTFAPALRDVISDLRSYRSNPLLALLRGSESTIQIEDAGRLVKAITRLNADISSLKEIRDISSGIQKTLHATVGYTYAPKVGVESTLPDRIDTLLQRLTVKVGDANTSASKEDLSEQSLGGANLIYLALKLLEYEFKLSTDKVAHFLLIEEPEAHIHTHIQKTLFERQSAHRTQVIVSTHSTHISSAAKVQSVNILAQKNGHAEVYQPSHGLAPVVMQRLERYLDAVRSTLLFAKGVILVEGVAELLMIPSMLKAVFGLSPDEMGISVISMDSAFFEHIVILFHDDRIRRRCAIISDHDQPFFQLPRSSKSDNEEEKHARASALVGKRRYDNLKTLVALNKWAKCFFAKHTFEVMFLDRGNGEEVCNVVDCLYSQSAAKVKSKEAITNNDIAVAGREILRLANTNGKGWFSLLLSEKLDANTYIPSYILKAVAFASVETLTSDVLKQIALYRLENAIFDQQVKSDLPSMDEFKKLSSKKAIQTFCSIAKEDDLTELVNYLNKYSAK